MNSHLLKIGLVFVGSYLVFLAWLFPINLVLDKVAEQIPPAIKLEQVDGGIWRGNLEFVYEDRVFQLFYHVCPFSTLSGICLEVRGEGVFLEAVVSYQQTEVVLEEVNLLIDAASLKSVSFAAPMLEFVEDASLKMHFNKVLLDKNFSLTFWDGIGNVQDLKILLIDKSFTGDIVFEDGSDTLLMKALVTNSNISAKGEVAFSKLDRKAKSVFTIDSTLPEINSLLQSMCKQDTGQRFRCEYSTNY